MKRFIIPALLLVVVGLTLAALSSCGEEQPSKKAAVDLGDGQWKELADADAAKAYQTILKLVADPGKSVPYLRERLLQMPSPTPQELSGLIAELNSESYSKRSAASHALEKLGQAGESTLIRHLNDKNPPEVQQRIEQILEKLGNRPPTVIELRVGRALEVLERIASKDAKEALQSVANKRVESWIGEAAEKGLARLETHPILAKPRPSRNPPPADDNAVAFSGRGFRFRFAAFAPDGKQVLISEQDNRVFLWDIATSTVRREVPTNVANGAVTWSPNGKMAATGRHLGQIDLWDTTKWELLRTFVGHPSAAANRKYPDDAKVFHLRFSADSRYLISAGRDASIYQWNVNTGELVGSLPLPPAMGNVDAIAPDGDFIAYHREGQYRDRSDVVIHDLARNREAIVFGGQKYGVVRGVFSSTGRFFLVGGWQVTLWEVASAQPVLTCGGWEERPSNVALSPSDRKALSFSSLHINRNKLWDLSNGEIIKEFKFSRDYLAGYDLLIFSPDGNYVLALDDKNTLTYWDMAKSESPRTLAGPFAAFPWRSMVAFLPQRQDAEDLRTASGAAFVRSISLPDHAMSMLFVSERNVIALSADGKRLLRRRTSDLQLVDLVSGQVLWTTPPILKDESVLSLVLSPDKSLAISAGTAARLWDLKNKKLAARLIGHQGLIRAVAFSHDGKRVATRGDDNRIKLWDVPNGTLLKTMEDLSGPFSGVAFSPDDRLIQSYGTSITSWEVSTGRATQSGKRPAPEVRHFARSKDGTVGLSGIFDNALTLWDMTTGTRIRYLEPTGGVTTPISDIVFSPDGGYATVYSQGGFGPRGDEAGRLHIWNTKTGKLVNYRWGK